MNDEVTSAEPTATANNGFDDDDNREPVVRFITFNMAGETYGLNVNQVREILRLNEFFPVPGAPEYVLGITNLRGNVITVIDARMRFGLPAVEYSDSARMIVVELNGETAAAVVVDSVSDVIDVPESSIDSTLKVNMNGDSRYTNGVVTHSDSLTILLNIESFIEEEALDS